MTKISIDEEAFYKIFEDAVREYEYIADFMKASESYLDFKKSIRYEMLQKFKKTLTKLRYDLKNT